MTDADRLRDLLQRAGLSQRAAAREIGMSDRMMRYYCSGAEPVPAYVLLAVAALAMYATGEIITIEDIRK